MDLPLGTIVQPADGPLEHVLFPDRGIVSVLSVASDGRRSEVGLYGWDGMSGAALLLGATVSPHQHMVQMEGGGWRLAADEFRRQVGASSAWRELLLHYVHAVMMQVAQTAMSNGAYQVEARLARWLLMCHDRVTGDDLPLTHEFIALMLGVRRPSVTVALHGLEGAGLIRARRGHVVVLQPDALRELAGESYGDAEAEYARLIGQRIENVR